MCIMSLCLKMLLFSWWRTVIRLWRAPRWLPPHLLLRRCKVLAWDRELSWVTWPKSLLSHPIKLELNKLRINWRNLWWELLPRSLSRIHCKILTTFALVVIIATNWYLLWSFFSVKKSVANAAPKPVAVTKKAEPEAFSSKQLPVEDIDQDRDNPQLVSYYAKDIYQYLRDLEVSISFWHKLHCKCCDCHNFVFVPTQKGYVVNSQYMDGYSIRPTMRTILVDWLVDVHGRFKMLQETLYLTVSVMDSFLQVRLFFFNWVLLWLF